VNTETFEHIRTWQHGPFRLELYDTFQTRYGKDILAYQFFHDKVLVFEGADFGASPLHSIDDDKTVAGVLSLLSCRPGDTDREHFDDYTQAQLAFAQEHGEELGYLKMELEEVAYDRDNTTPSA
jgi:hypothetical protein